MNRWVIFLLGPFALSAPVELRAQTLMAVGESAVLDFAGTLPGPSYSAPEADDIYLVVSVSERRLTVRRGREILHRFPVGVGTGAYLRRQDASGAWQFDTPEGVFTIGRKKENPVWYAPDWHYIEKGLSVPPAYSPQRYFAGALGDYALYLGDDIAIHGTRDAKSVGRASTHGCLRLSNEAIATVFSLVGVGTKVIITS
ncbi:MAG TPA: L,D-transpeptidase [Gemmatimonadota bacterium]|nr:L,D-transpeptidase [Gemmatimonadota bacterium]